jgi:hypothetical protein
VNLGLILHFLKFDILTNSLDIKEWIEQLYISNDLTLSFPDKLASLKLCVERKDAPEAASIRAPARAIFAETNLCNARCYYEDGSFFSQNHGDYWHEMKFELETNTIHANLGGEYLESGQAVISNMIRPILQSFALPFYGLKTLHGAVASKGGRTIFLAGHGGMGKTTTAIQLMRSGYEILSDDGPFFFVENRDAYALSSLDFLHLTENTLRLFPELRARVIGIRDNRKKFAVRISDLNNGGAWKQAQRITDYIQLRRRPDVIVPRLRRIDRNLVHRSLIDESMVIFRRAPFRASSSEFRKYSDFIFNLLTMMVQRAETYELEFADHHLPEIPEILAL